MWFDISKNAAIFEFNPEIGTNSNLVLWTCQKWEKQFGLDQDFKIQDSRAPQCVSSLLVTENLLVKLL